MFEVGDFWFIVRGQLNSLKQFNLENVKNMIWEFWEAHRNKDKAAPDSIKKLAAAYNLSGKKDKTRCDFCLKFMKKIANGHTTDYCFFGDKEGWDKINKSNLAESNKLDSQYQCLLSEKVRAFHDSGCTPTSYFLEKPVNLIKSQSLIKTASNQTVLSNGFGNVKVGDIILKGVRHVPSFSYNLVSGIQIMKMGFRQVFYNDRLEILKGDKVVYTGQYNQENGLIELNDVDHQENLANNIKSSLGLYDWHKKLGHVGSQMLKRTSSKHNIKFIDNSVDCESCLKSKATSKRVTRFKRDSVEYDVLEMIKSDTTPFPVQSYDGYLYNVKYVCRSIGFIQLYWIKDFKSATILETFIKFKMKYEKFNWKEYLILQMRWGYRIQRCI